MHRLSVARASCSSRQARPALLCHALLSNVAICDAVLRPLVAFARDLLPSASPKNNPAREGGLTGGEVKSAAGEWWVETPPPDNAPGRWWVARAREPDQAVNLWSGDSVAPLAGSSEASFPSVPARVWPCQNRGSPQILEEVPWLPWRRVRSKARAGSKITNRAVNPTPSPRKPGVGSLTQLLLPPCRTLGPFHVLGQRRQACEQLVLAALPGSLGSDLETVA